MTTIREIHTDDWKSVTKRQIPYVPEPPREQRWEDHNEEDIRRTNDIIDDWFALISLDIGRLTARKLDKQSFANVTPFGNSSDNTLEYDPIWLFKYINSADPVSFGIYFHRIGSFEVRGKKLKDDLEKDGLPSGFPLSHFSIPDSTYLKFPIFNDIKVFLLNQPISDLSTISTDWSENGKVSVVKLVLEFIIIFLIFKVFRSNTGALYTILGTMFGFMLKQKSVAKIQTIDARLSHIQASLEDLGLNIDLISDQLRDLNYSDQGSSTDLSSIISSLQLILSEIGVKLRIL